MIVKFQNRFIVPGFGRHRFEGTVRDVPEALRNHLPKRAEILSDDYADEETLIARDEGLRAADFARMQEESTAQKSLERAGMAGFAEELDDAEPEDLWYDGREYKTPAAKKAAITRSEKGFST